MSTPIRHRLRHATEAAWKAARSQTAGAGAEPQPGDLFVIPETSHLAVEWAVIERDAAGRLYVVPADTWDQVGSHDVHVSSASACGPLSLRCGLGLWLPPEILDPELRSGVLESADLTRARDTWQSIERGTVCATDSQRETDTEIEYRDWIEKGPAQARDLLDRAWRLGEREGWRRGGWRSTALAASLLLALAAGSGLVWLLRNEDRELSQAAVEPLAVTLVRTRGVRKISVPSGVEALELRVGDSYPEPCRLEVRSEDPPRTIRTSERLTVLLPRDAVPAGEYRILVLRGDRAERLGDYRLEIEYQDDEHRP